MTDFTKNIMIAAAALMVAAGVAGAQTIKAEVPFRFRAAGTVLPAGSYRVSASHSSGGLQIDVVVPGNTTATVYVPSSLSNCPRTISHLG